MSDDRLYEITDADPPGGTPVLIHALSGFVDAGESGQGLAEHLLATRPHRTIARFDTDELVDYRSQRPQVTFVTDHFEQYAPPELAVYAVRDDSGVEFLLLNGPEPDTKWEAFVEAVRDLVEQYDVRLTVGGHGIPMAVPHTRPLSYTAHATRSDLVTTENPWEGELQVPAGVSSLLEIRLGEAGHDAMGFAVHVPHYLADNRYPDAILTLVRAVSRVTGLMLPAGDLPDEIEEVRTLVDQQVAENDNIARIVNALEEQHDVHSGAEGRSRLPVLRESLAGTDIAAEAERFLAELNDDEDGGGGEDDKPQ